MSFVAAMRKY